MTVNLGQLEAAEKAARCPLGFPVGDVNNLIATLTRTGREYRQWSKEYASKGDLSKAWYWHKEAEQNLGDVKWWMARREQCPN